MLTKKQRRVAEAIYQGRLTDEQIVEQCRVSGKQLRRWLQDAEFAGELDRLADESVRQVRFTISRYGPIAALKLAALLSSEKDDTARRASLDVIDRCIGYQGRRDDSGDGGNGDGSAEGEMTDEQARQMLLTLAEGYARPSDGNEDSRVK